MNQIPQDQGGPGGRPASEGAGTTGNGRGAARGTGPGAARHRSGAGPEQRSESAYSEAARYLDSAWQASSASQPAPPASSAPDSFEAPTQVVPVHQAPTSPSTPDTAPAAPAAGDADRAARREPTPEHDLGAYAMSAGAGVPATGGNAREGGTGASPGGDGRGDGPQSPEPPRPPRPGGDHTDDGSDNEAPGPPERPGARRRSVVIWSVVGALVLGGAGLVAANTLNGDDSKTTSTSVSVGTPDPAPSPAPPSTTPASGAPSGSATASASGAKSTSSASGSPSASKSPTGSRSGSASASPESTKVDADNDGIVDDPGSLDPSKLAAPARTAYSQAKNAMAAEGITMTLTSGKRTYEHQQDLWEQEVQNLGSEDAARMRVLPPDESSHVDGIAIDINIAAQPWMKSKGSQYGWCQIYGNESWHFEFNASYKTAGCPTLKPHP